MLAWTIINISIFLVVAALIIGIILTLCRLYSVRCHYSFYVDRCGAWLECSSCKNVLPFNERPKHCPRCHKFIDNWAERTWLEGF